MIVGLLAAIAALVCVVAVLLRALTRLQRQHARREDALLDRLLHATGNTWTPPPAEEARRDLRDDLKRTRWTAAPEQHVTE